MPKSSIGLADRFLGDESEQQSEQQSKENEELVCFSKYDLIPMTLGKKNFVCKELIEELLPDEDMETDELDESDGLDELDELDDAEELSEEDPEWEEEESEESEFEPEFESDDIESDGEDD